ncbi:hypothetical protein B0H19DRAFT_1235286 [Mycena capillaripes]|nr:hypothetical protein B0H19DRAFT_1235286 [Mycena capillaripes]
MGVEQETHKNCAVALAVLLALVDRAVKMSDLSQAGYAPLAYTGSMPQWGDSYTQQIGPEEMTLMTTSAWTCRQYKGRWDGRDKKKRRKSERRSLAYSMWGEGEDGGKGKRTKWSPITPSVNPLPMHPHHDALGFE